MTSHASRRTAHPGRSSSFYIVASYRIELQFKRDIKTIGKHINNALKEELEGLATVANFATVQKEGNRTVIRQMEYYNLDMILSIGYRVKSQSGVKFRIWANKILKDYLLKGYVLNQRVQAVARPFSADRQQRYLPYRCFLERPR
jgi:hypothetical protein